MIHQILCLFISLTIFASADTVLDLKQVAGKLASDVDKVLGKPPAQEKTKNGPKRIYKDGKIEIVFIAGKADWITVNSMQSTNFDERALESLGLKPETPTMKNANVIRWEPHTLYKSVSIFPLSGKVDYAYIKVATK